MMVSNYQFSLEMQNASNELIQYIHYLCIVKITQILSKVGFENLRTTKTQKSNDSKYKDYILFKYRFF